MTRTVVAVLGFLLHLALAQGYGPSTMVTYDIRTLTYRPGTVYISPKYITVLEFGDLIDELGTSSPSLVQIRVGAGENILFLKALKNAGSADLVVRIGGYVALFRLVVDAKMELPRRYVIAMPRPGPSEALREETPPSQREGGSPEGQKPTPTVQTQTPSPATPTPEGLPPWLKATLSVSRSGGSAVVYYALKNEGKEPVRMSPEGIRAYKGPNALPFRLVRTAFGKEVDLLAPGETATGAIIIPNAPDGVEVEWKLTAGNSEFTLRARE